MSLEEIREDEVSGLEKKLRDKENIYPHLENYQNSKGLSSKCKIMGGGDGFIST